MGQEYKAIITFDFCDNSVSKYMSINRGMGVEHVYTHTIKFCFVYLERNMKSYICGEAELEIILLGSIALRKIMTTYILLPWRF